MSILRWGFHVNFESSVIPRNLNYAASVMFRPFSLKQFFLKSISTNTYPLKTQNST